MTDETSDNNRNETKGSQQKTEQDGISLISKKRWSHREEAINNRWKELFEDPEVSPDDEEIPPEYFHAQVSEFIFSKKIALIRFRRGFQA